MPSGTVTFLFSDIEGSTRLLQELGERYPEVLEDHNRLLRAAFAASGGHEVGSQGDAFFFVFSSARNAVAAAVAAQKALGQHPWPDGTTVRVRIGLHTGEGTLAGDDYVGLDVHRAARIAAAGHGGQILVSQVTSVLVDGDLPESVSLIDLGPHRLKDLQKTEHIFQVVHPELTARFPALRSLDISPHNLPVQITSFIGREQEMAEIRRLLADAHLVTLRGPGGAGKTRLAIQVAADHLDSFLNGVWLVELAPIADPANVPQTVASSLGLREPARAVTEVLAEYLRTRSLLLVLDNCEQVLEATAALCAMLLRQCPNLRVLATSRETLGVTGERIYQVQPLALPDPGQAGSADMANQFAAVRLFVERAAGYQPGFKVTDDNIRTIVELCRRLDGIPLAIELAAARVRVLSVEQILARLEDRFRLLTGGPKTGLAHHQTLRAALDWGYDLLTDNERAMFRRVAVFAGGFTLESAEGICAGGVIDAGEVLDLLARLVDKSLVVVEQISAEVRYRLLETIRQYGLERLRDAGEEAAVRERHRAYFLELAEEAEMELQGPDQKTWLDRLETDHDNLRAALEWSRSSPDRIEAGLRLAGSLTHFWEVRGYWEEGRRWLDDLLPRTDPSASLARVKAMTAAAGLALKDGDMPRVEALANESLALSRQLGDKKGAASCLAILGVRACRLEDYGTAEALGGEGLTLSRETGDNFATAWAQAVLGLVARAKGDLDRSDRFLSDSLTLLRAIGHQWASAIVLVNLGLLARDRGELDRAMGYLEEALGILRQLGDKSYVSYTLLNLGTIASARHDYARAGTIYRECLGLRKELQETRGIVTCLAALGCTAAGLKEHRKAAVLFGAYDAQREATGASIPPIFRAEYERQVRSATAALGEAAFADAWAEGRAMSMDQAVDAALKEPSRV